MFAETVSTTAGWHRPAHWKTASARRQTARRKQSNTSDTNSISEHSQHVHLYIHSPTLQANFWMVLAGEQQACSKIFSMDGVSSHARRDRLSMLPLHSVSSTRNAFKQRFTAISDSPIKLLPTQRVKQPSSDLALTPQVLASTF